MFRTILTLSYLIPSIYLFIRIWMLFIPKKYRSRFIIIYSLFFSVYPLSRIIQGKPQELFEIVSNYLLPFFLYLFLFVLVTDILLFFNLLSGLVPREKLRNDKLKLRVLLAILCMAVLVVTGGIINFNTIRTTEYKIDVEGGTSRIGQIRMAFISDFHIDDKTPVWFVKNYVTRISEIKPDLLLYGGDIVEGHNSDGKMEKITDLLNDLSAEYGVYGVLGNHEHYNRQDEGTFFTRTGIKILRDTAIIFDKAFILAGRNDSHFPDRLSVENLLEEIPDSLPLILLDHRPTEIDQVGRTHADIQFSGHTHHGQLFPINLVTKAVYKLSWGHLKSGNTHFFVSSGLRLWGPPVRTVAKSEIVIVEVRFIK